MKRFTPLDVSFEKLFLITSILCAFSLISVSDLEEAEIYAQENSTAILEEIRTLMRDEIRDISTIKNLTSAEVELLQNIAIATSRTPTEAEYTALSVFFLGIALLIFGLRLTMPTKAAHHISRYFNLMMWALTLPVLVLVAAYQIGIATGNPIELYTYDEPYLYISFLMWIPIGMVQFLLFAQRKITEQELEK